MAFNFLLEQKQSNRAKAAISKTHSQSVFPQNNPTSSTLLLYRAGENQAVRPSQLANAADPEAGTATPRSTGLSHDFSQIPLYPRACTEIQAKLRVSTPGDMYEQEADRVADQVMRKSGRGQLQTKPVREDRACETTAPPLVQEVISSPGLPLDSTTREWMGSRFGHDFSRVRVHTDERAVQSARALGARAYSVVSELVFDAGQYAPATPEGQRLLAHELTHVIQQRSSGTSLVQRQPQGAQAAPGSRRVPPGPGEYTPAEYEAWLKAHPKRVYRIGGPWEGNVFYARYTPKWFWDQGYVYAGRGGNFPWYWFEVWISSTGGGKEFRVWRISDGGAKSTPSAPQPSPGSQSPGSQSPGSQKTPTSGRDYIDPNADRERLFGPVIASKEDVDAAFGEGEVVLYEDGTAELFLKGTTQSYVFRPVSGGRYIVFGPDGKRLENTWEIPKEDIPDPVADADE